MSTKGTTRKQILDALRENDCVEFDTDGLDYEVIEMLEESNKAEVLYGTDTNGKETVLVTRSTRWGTK